MTWKISHSELLRLLGYDGETGLFTWRINRGRIKAGSLAGKTDGQGYRIVCVAGERIGANRLAWFYVHGAWPAGYIDHINGDRADNRIANLRDVTRAQNRQNVRSAQTNNKVGLLGVSRKRGKFSAEINSPSGRRWLGVFDTAEEAHAAYVLAKRELHSANTL